MPRPRAHRLLGVGVVLGGLIAAVASANLVVKLLGLAILTPLLGINGIALSTSLMYLFTLLLLGLGARVKQT